MSKKIGLFFGSFNPIHVGHLIIASEVYEAAGLDQIWFVVSPHNPLKEKKTLLHERHRLYLVNLAIEDDKRFKSSDIEFSMPKPSYTVHTLAYLQEKYPDYNFSLIMGSDTLDSLHRWKNHTYILSNYDIYLYTRKNSEGKYLNEPRVKQTQAAMIEISSSKIRELIHDKKEFRYYVPDKVYQYLQEMHFYEK